MSKASTPRAVIHKRILDIARDEPDASIERIASEVSGATPDLVDRVLDDYGDPAESTKHMTQLDVSVDSLTDRQCEILRTIHRNPDASQRTLAGYLGITAPTVSRHLNKIPDWDWDRRLDFAEAVIDEDEDGVDEGAVEGDVTEAPVEEGEITDEMASGGENEAVADGEPDESDGAENEDTERGLAESETANGGPAEVAETVIISTDGAGVEQGTLKRLDERIAGLEQRFDEDVTELVVEEPELVQKIVHVCMDAETITEDEELQIIRALLT